MIGSKLSHFKITAKLGEGGMGEVYRAQDTKLGREVAIKVLPMAVAGDPERLARFEREAKVLAALNHSHIAAIYSLEAAELRLEAGDDGASPERSGSGSTEAARAQTEAAASQSEAARPEGHRYRTGDIVNFLVMELAEGEDLKEIIARSPIPLAKALPIALQVAEALEAAHEKGIIHRDLKPANLKLTPDGEVKILDFGLAKALERGTGTNQDPSQSPLSLSPTLTAEMTQAGVLLGTAAYMSPEQARGQEADKRADIWAFGVVLLEMLTGRTVFSGDTVSDTLAGILAREPEWDSLPATTPRAIRRLLQRCLEKGAVDRLRDIGEARIEIRRYLAAPAADAEPEDPVAAVAAARQPAWRRALPWALFGLTAVGLATAVWRLGAGPSLPDSVIRAVLPPPPGSTFQLNPFHPGPAVISPDGTRVVVAALDEDGAARLYVRSLDSTEPQVLSGTEGAGYPFWSPDSRWIGYFSQIDSTLKKIDATGGPPITLCEAGNGKGATWSAEGVILFAPEADTAIYRVAATGGEPAPVTELANERHNSHRHPRFMPDGRHFLFMARANPAENSAVMLGDLDDGRSRELLRSKTQAEYASGHLLFTRESTLMAQPFDSQRLELSGEARPIVEKTLEIGGAAIAVFSASSTGALVYHTGSMAGGLQLEWRDREGRQLGELGEQADYEMIAMSPDGKTAAVVAYDAAGTGDLYLFDVDSGLHSRFTFDPGNELSPVWSPDSQSLVFAARHDRDIDDIYRKALGGLGETELLYASEENKVPTSLSPDGRWLLYERFTSATKNDIFVWSVEEGGEPRSFVQTEANERGAVFSRDGQWVAYFSRESGRDEVYVTPFPGPGRKWQVSTDGGLYPQWRNDGRELFYAQHDGQLMAVEVLSDADTFRVGRVQPLFRIGPPRPYGADFSPTPDGQRLLVSQIFGRQADTVLNLVVNWPAELERR